MKDFVRVGVAVPIHKCADCAYNKTEIISLIRKAAAENVRVVVFPELSISGYSCEDMFAQDTLVAACEDALGDIAVQTADCDVFTALGMAVRADNQLFNCAVCLHKGVILGVVPKTYLPNYTEFYDERWFSPASRLYSDHVKLCGTSVPIGTDILFKNVGEVEFTVGIEICEDVWSVIPPSSYHALAGAEIILNLSASNELVYKDDYRRGLLTQQSGRIIGAYAYASAGFGESTADLVYSGHSLICENGVLLAETEKFQLSSQLVYSDTDVGRLKSERRRISTFMKAAPNEIKKYRTVTFTSDTFLESTVRRISPHPFIPSPYERDERCENIFGIQVSGLAKRLVHTSAKAAVIGISGGLDSTLALLCAVRAFDYLKRDRKGIIGITMPGFGTTDRTYNNAMALMETLGVTCRKISIADAAMGHFRDIGHDPEIKDVTYENVQARERTQVLMDTANMEGGLVVGTGDLSEIALGWSTYNGDHMSMYAVNCGIPKTLVRILVAYIADTIPEAREILTDILNTPVSPELLPASENGTIAQKTEDIIGPYELHDFFLYYMVRFGFTPAKITWLALQAFGTKYTADTITKWLTVYYKRFFSQQFKRSCIPDGPKVGSVGLSPRGDLKMPSDLSPDAWTRGTRSL
jgi:NAD+ synthase (glutamine-hydrolysing)